MVDCRRLHEARTPDEDLETIFLARTTTDPSKLTSPQNLDCLFQETTMRHGRAKAARRTLQFFQRTIGLKAPYHLLLDGTFVVAIVRYNLPLHDRLDRLLQHAPFQLSWTVAAREEVENLLQQAPKEKKELLDRALAWAKEHCQLLEAPASSSSSSSGLGEAASGALALLQERNRMGGEPLFLASQDDNLLDQARQSPVPIIRLARGSVLLLEQPSQSIQKSASLDERAKWKLSSSGEEKLIDLVHEERRQQTTVEQPTQRRKRKASEPNPLSCKKKQATKKPRNRRKKAA